MADQPRYRSLGALKAGVICALIMQAVHTIGKTAIPYWQSRQMVDVAIEPTPADLSRNLLLLAGANMALMFGLVAATVVYLCAFFRLHKNAQALGVRDMPISAGWMVAWFLIPVANLIMPFFAIRDLWKASVPNDDSRHWRTNSNPPLVAIWWALRIGGSLLAFLPVFVFPAGPISLASTGQWIAFDIGLMLLVLASFTLQAVVFFRILHMQEEKLERFGEDAGTKLTCPSCGEPIPRDMKLEQCPVCGAPLIADFLPESETPPRNEPASDASAVPPALG